MQAALMGAQGVGARAGLVHTDPPPQSTSHTCHTWWQKTSFWGWGGRLARFPEAQLPSQGTDSLPPPLPERRLQTPKPSTVLGNPVGCAASQMVGGGGLVTRPLSWGCPAPARPLPLWHAGQVQTRGPSAPSRPACLRLAQPPTPVPLVGKMRSQFLSRNCF